MESPFPHTHRSNPPPPSQFFMAVLKPLQILLLMAPLLLASQTISAHTSSNKPSHLPQQTTNGDLPSSAVFHPHPRNNTTAISDEMADKIAVQRFRSHRRSMRKRRRRARRRAQRYSAGFVPLPNICFAILLSILQIMVSVSTN